MFFMQLEHTSLVEVMLQISEYLTIMNLHVKMSFCMNLKIKNKLQFSLSSKGNYFLSSGESAGEPTCILTGS